MNRDGSRGSTSYLAPSMPSRFPASRTLDVPSPGNSQIWKTEAPQDVSVQATVIQILESHRFHDIHTVSHALHKIRPVF